MIALPSVDVSALLNDRDFNCVQRVHNMETQKIGVREFRENLADYLESGAPLTITRHGEALGYYIPARKRSRRAKLKATRAAAKELDEMIASWGASEDELMEEINENRRRKPRIGGTILAHGGAKRNPG